MIPEIDQNSWCGGCYILSAELIVRNAISWLNEEGRIIDPYENKETNTATARFVGALGLLMQAGHCRDMKKMCARALTPSVLQ